MTVAEWIERRSADVPESLTREVLAALDRDAVADQAATGHACMHAATRLLAALLRERAFGRDSAVRLLAVDALTTFALEHASEQMPGGSALGDFARRSAEEIGHVMATR